MYEFVLVVSCVVALIFVVNLFAMRQGEEPESYSGPILYIVAATAAIFLVTKVCG